MEETVEQQSNPFSTGGGGTNFETRVQAAFAVLLLSGRIAPCLPPFPIVRIKLQGRYVGFHTDDFIVFCKQPDTEQQAKLLAQIKHEISVTVGNETFAEVIRRAWNDFNSDDFNPQIDAIALITGPLSKTDTNNVRPILEWARYSETEEEFLSKVNTADFSSDEKRKKLDAFKIHLKEANSGNDISDNQLWSFLKAFHLIGYDLDTESGSTFSLLYSLIERYSNKEPSFLWARVLDAVQNANQNAGTLTLETMPEDIRTAFNKVDSSGWSKDVTKLMEHGNYILEGIRVSIGEVHIKRPEAIAQLFDLAESTNFILVTGERGTGKSSLIRSFSEFVNYRAPIFCLRTEDLDKSHLDAVFSAIGLKVTLGDIEAGFALMPRKYLIIESLEKLLELQHTSAFADLLLLLNKQQGWTVIATCRDYAYQLITFNFLQPSGVRFQEVVLSGFNDDQVRSLCEQLDFLKKFAENQELKVLLKSPFLAELAYRVLKQGTTFAPGDGEREFRTAIWRDVIAKEQVRKNGMPIKRKQVFINIAIRRARYMVYGVPASEFDYDAIQKLEEDNLIRRDLPSDLVSPSHDVLEDWALEQYIEDTYQQLSTNLESFLDAIGNEPAINRAFRLWLHQKLKYGDNVRDFVFSILNNLNIQRSWQDETIAAILLGSSPGVFLELLKDRLFLDDGELLKRFCFILRIACQAPSQNLFRIPKGGTENLIDTLFLKPYGKGWEAIIRFLLENKSLFSENMLSHLTAVLNDWTSLIDLYKESPVPSREAGLLALHLLDGVEKSYRDESKDRNKLLSVIIKTMPAIHVEFVDLLNKDVYISRSKRPHYVNQFCEMCFSLVESGYICKHDPEILINLANFEWFINETEKDYKSWQSGPLDSTEYFGLQAYPYNFFPPSGMKGPFRNLLNYQPRKGLDFILNLLNTCADRYAHSDLDQPHQPGYPRIKYSEPQIKQVVIYLNDGSSVKQYCSGRLWLAYRGISDAYSGEIVH